MITQTVIPALTITKSADEWRAILVDPQPFLDEVRSALADQHSAADTRTNHLTISPDRQRTLQPADIAAAAKKQNKKTSKRFLAAGTGTFSCAHCDKTFATLAIRNRHAGRMHKGETTAQFPTFAQTADDASVA